MPLSQSAQSVPHRFDQVLAIYSNHTAIFSPGNHWLYSHLDKMIRSIQAQIRSLNPRPLSVFCLAVSDPSLLVAAMLAVLRERHIYCVLDPRQPESWLERVLQTSETSAILTDEILRRQFTSLANRHSLPCLSLFSDLKPVSETDCTNPDLRPEDPAYIAFTSGSTGMPKGLLHTHANLLHEVNVHTTTLDIVPTDRFSALYALHAVGSNRDVYAALLNGAAYCPFPHQDQGMSALKDWLIEKQITILHAVPSLFRQLMHCFDPEQRLESVRVTFLAGDRVVPQDIALHRTHLKNGARFYTGIGASETSSLYCHGFTPPEFCLSEGKLSSGKPVPGYEVRLSDTGEIIVAGSFLAQGYIGERPLRGLSTDANGQKTFATGDQGSFDAEGNLIFQGRNDNRIKINGQIVELSAVDLKLRNIAGVRDCLVQVVERDGSSQIVAYLLPSEKPIPTDLLREQLSQELPLYAIPSIFCWLSEFPLLENGKISKERLPNVFDSGAATEAIVEKEFVDIFPIWRRIFPQATPNGEIDFHTLGGDSLAAVDLSVALEERFGLELKPEDIQLGLTMRKIADRIASHAGSKIERDDDLNRREISLLRAATTYFISQMPGSTFSRGIGVRLEGEPSTQTPLIWLQIRNSPSQTQLLSRLSRYRPVFVLPSGLTLLEEDSKTSERLFVFYAKEFLRQNIRHVEISGFCHAGLLGMSLAGVLNAHGIEVSQVSVLDAQPPLPPGIALTLHFLQNRPGLKKLRETLSKKYRHFAKEYRRFSSVTAYRGRGTWLVTRSSYSSIRVRLAGLVYFRSWKPIRLAGKHASLLSDSGEENLPLLVDHLKGETDAARAHPSRTLAPSSV